MKEEVDDEQGGRGRGGKGDECVGRIALLPCDIFTAIWDVRMSFKLLHWCPSLDQMHTVFNPQASAASFFLRLLLSFLPLPSSSSSLLFRLASKPPSPLPHPFRRLCHPPHPPTSSFPRSRPLSSHPSPSSFAPSLLLLPFTPFLFLLSLPIPLPIPLSPPSTSQSFLVLLLQLSPSFLSLPPPPQS